jgi:hypothetical protein
MLWWDDKLVEAVERLGLKLISGARYMDDIRVWLHAVRLGWRMVNGELRFSTKWSRDVNNPRWKPLHVAAGWNSRKRRVAKQRSKTSWYKGKADVEPPTSIQEEENAARFSIHKEFPNQPNILSGGSWQDTSLTVPVQVGAGDDGNTTVEGSEQGSSGAETGAGQKAGRKAGEKWNKKKEWAKQTDSNLRWFTQDRDIQEKEGESEVEKEIRWNGSHSKRRMETEETVWTTAPHQECHFLDNTAGGLLAKRFQEAKVEAGNVTGYRIRITESAGTALSVLLPSTNPWGP